MTDGLTPSATVPIGSLMYKYMAVRDSHGYTYQVQWFTHHIQPDNGGRETPRCSIVTTYLRSFVFIGSTVVTKRHSHRKHVTVEPAYSR